MKKLRTILSALALVSLLTSGLFGKAAADPVTLYLPLVSRPAGEIYGTISLNGQPVEGIPVTIWLLSVDRAGYYWDDVGDVMTDAFGVYRFQNMGTVPHGDENITFYGYIVDYTNPSTLPDGKLAYYETHELDTYSYGSSVELENFDIADIALQEPVDMSIVPFPVTFTWIPRSGLSTDDYQLKISEESLGGGFFYSPFLGYGNSFTLDSLPPNFGFGYTEQWLIYIYTPSGGHGWSHIRQIQFRQ